MLAKEKYNEMISFIEKEVCSEEITAAQEIARKVCQKIGLGGRDTNAIFSFLTGKPLLEYIKERKLMTAYKELIGGSCFDVNHALEIAGYDNQSSFGKKFKERFDMTPSEAYAKKIASLFVSPKTWESISEQEEEVTLSAEKAESVQNNIFGLDEKQFSFISQALDCKAILNLNDSQAELAYQIALEKKVDIVTAFEFIYEFLQVFDPDRRMTYEELKREYSAHLDIAMLCLELGHSVHNAIYMSKVLEQNGLSICELPTEVLRLYKIGEISFSEFVGYYKLYIKYASSEPYEEYYRAVLDDTEPEEAARGLGYWEDFEKVADAMHKADPEDFDLSFEKWAEEESDYTHAEYVDEEYDTDNQYYNDDSDGLYY